jgi:hypothetical protein
MRQNGEVVLVVAFSHHTGKRLAELAVLFILLASPLLASARLKAGTYRIAGGVGLALGAVLLIVAIHWGHFG